MKVAAPAKPPEPEPQPTPATERRASARPAEPAPTGAPEPITRRAPEPPADLPELSITRLRWHPEARRRSAVLEVDSRKIEDAREGDIIAGIEIEEIRPDAIVVRVGSSLQRIPLQP